METNSIKQLMSVKTVEQILALQSIGIYSIRDMAEYAPFRYAEILVGSIENQTIGELNLNEYLTSEAVAGIPNKMELNVISQLPITSIININPTIAAVFKTNFFLNTIEEFASFEPFLEAKELIALNIHEPFYENPSAPKALIPNIIGSTYTSVRFSNYVKEKEYILDDSHLVFHPEKDEPSPQAEMIDIFYKARFKFHLGYLASIKQKWVNAGTYLGEILHSLALAPAESRNIAFIEWYSQQKSSRSEDTTITENLDSQFFQTRALNEVVSTTAREHLNGETDIDATTKTSGTGVTLGIAGGKGKEGSGISGSLGASHVESKGTTQGTLISETTGERTVCGEVTQNISDSTVQNSSNVRSMMSTVVVEDAQSGSQKAQTRNVTNYNHSHALTIQYFEVLQKYNINTYIDGLTPVLYLPFNPIDFDINLIRKYWYLLKTPVNEAVPNFFAVFDQTVKDFNPNNEAFDITSARIDKIKITRSKTYSADIRVKLKDSDPTVNLKIAKNDLDKCLELAIKGHNTYLNYEVLDKQVYQKNSFGGANSVKINEGITSRIKSNFKSELKRLVKWYLDKDSGKTKSTSITLPIVSVSSLATDQELDDNEIGGKNSRQKLIDSVENGDGFEIINGDDYVDFTIDLEYHLLDNSNNPLTLGQTYSNQLTFKKLQDGYDEEIFNITEYINSQVLSMADVNPISIIKDLEDHFNAYKYNYTKYLLNHSEKEQIIDVIQHLGIQSPTYNIPITEIIDPNPLGVVENLMIFKLKKAPAKLSKIFGQKFSFSGNKKEGPKGAPTPISGEGIKREIIYKGELYTEYTITMDPTSTEDGTGIAAYTKVFKIASKPNPDKKYSITGKILTKNLKDLITSNQESEITGSADKNDGTELSVEYKPTRLRVTPLDNKGPLKIPSITDLATKLDLTLKYKESENEEAIKVINDYIDDLKLYEKEAASISNKNTVFLPTSGVFAEAILGLSNASEYVDVRRFYNWVDSPIPNLAPAISDVNVNQDYSKDISQSINPTVPASVLNQIMPQVMPETSLNNALQAVQNGAMFNDMSKTDQLVSTLSSLATLANNTAQLAGTLSGEAGKNALNAALELGKMVANMTDTCIGSNKAPAPKTPTDRGATTNAMDSVQPDSNGNISAKDQAKIDAVGGSNIKNSNNNQSKQLTTSTGYTQFEMIIDSVNIVKGKRFSDNVIKIINTIIGGVAGDLPDWVMPYALELFWTYSSLDVNGTLNLKDPNGLVVESKNFKISSSDALAILSDGKDRQFNAFVPQTVQLKTPIQKLEDLYGVETITAFSNTDPVAVIDVLIKIGVMFIPGINATASATGLDELNPGGWVFSAADYSAIVANAVMGTNMYSQDVEYFDKLRENWRMKNLVVYMDNKSTQFDYFAPKEIENNVCIAIPTSPPHLIIW